MKRMKGMNKIKKELLLLALVLVGMTAAQEAEALEWEAKTTLRVIPRPVGADDFLVKSTGIHRAVITKLSVADALFPIRMRINLGELLHNGFPVRGCGTGWFWAASTLSLSCSTKYTQEPCEDGIWDASTLAQIQGHPSGGYRFEPAAQPVFIDCACL